MLRKSSFKRTPYIKDAEILNGLLKAHVKEDPSKCQLLWQYKDQDVIATAYKDFFIAVAKTGHMLSNRQVAKALKKHFEGDRPTLNAFAKCVADVLSSCKGKARHIRSGQKTCGAVLQIIEAYKSSDCAAASSSQASNSQVGSQVESQVDDVEDSASEAESDDDAISVDGCADDVPSAADEANAALAKAKEIFRPRTAEEKRTLARHDSAVSVKSSEPPSPKEAGRAQALKVHLILFLSLMGA
jgi:hypothetical protein